MRIKISPILVGVLVFSSCSSLAPQRARIPAQENAPDSATSLDNATSKDGSGLGERYYKFSVLLDGAGRPTKLIYQNTEKFEFHADFLATLPEFQGMKRAQIDDVTYNGGAKRRALLGVLTKRAADDSIVWQRFSLVMSDAPQGEQVVEVHRMLLASAGKDGFEGPLEFDVLPHQLKGFVSHQDTVRRAKIGIHIPDGDTRATAYTDAWNFGTLEWVGSELELAAKLSNGKITSRTIIVTDQNLREFPAVAGVISAVPLTPASHSVLLGQMYGAPIVHVLDAVERFKPLEGRTIYLNSHAPPGSQVRLRKVDYVLDPSSEDLQKLASLKVRPRLDVKVDEREDEIKNAGSLSFPDIPAYGGKSSQMGIILKTLPANSLAGSTAIPLFYFKKFLAGARVADGSLLGEFIRAKTASIADLRTSDTQTKAVLSEIRGAISAAKIPDDVIQPIRKVLGTTYPAAQVRLFLRSSSNAEDGAEFNGAGLYDSAKAWFRGGPTDELEKGLKDVWASLYTDRGFIARRNFQVDESKVGMAILVQEFLKLEGANGIALIHVPAGGERPEVEIVTQKDDAQVTAGTGEIRPEVVTLNLRGGIDIEQPYDGLTKERSVLRVKEYLELGRHMSALAKAYGAPAKETHIESEWKLMRNPNGDKLVVLQVRPVPKRSLAKLADGSTALFLMPTTLQGRFDDEHPLAVHSLFTPKDVRIKMKSFTHKAFLAGKVTLDEAAFRIQGHEYVLKSVKGQIAKDNHAQEPPELRFTLPNAHVPGLRFSIQIPDEINRNVYSSFHDLLTVQFSTGDNDFKRFGESEYNGLNASLKQDQFWKMSDFYDDKVVGTEKIELEIKGKRTVKIVLTQVKTTGEGDGRWTKIGQAELTGLIARPIKLGKLACGYGANHHQGFETYFFDLLGDTTLSPAEKAAITKMGRYLNMESGKANLSAGDGKKPIDIGKWGDHGGEE